MDSESPAPTSYGFIFAVAVGLLLAVAATGVAGRVRFSLSPIDQALLLGHLILGILFVAPFLVYLVYHVYVVYATPILRAEVSSQILGALVAVLTLVAVGTGIDLAVEGAQVSRAAWILAHQVSAYGALALLPVHIGWAYIRRRVLGRSTAIPLRDRVLIPSGIMSAATAAFAAMAFLFRPPTPAFAIPAGYTYVKNQKGTKEPFFPGLARTVDGKLIPVDNLSGSARCAVCHKDIFDQWRASTHSFSASNDHYLAQVKLRIFDVPVKPHLGARFCANCHEPIAMFAGEIDPKGHGIEIPENREEGLACLACHRVQRLHSGIVGNANIVMAPHRPYLLQTASDPLQATIGRMLLRSRPEVHKAELMKPLYRKPEFCSACHKFFIDEAINGHGFFRLQNTFDEWRASPYADPKSGEYKRCQDCHMPLVESDDPAAKPYLEHGRTVYEVRSHRFLGSNTARPYLDAQVGDPTQVASAKQQLAMTEAFLKSGVVTLTLDAPERVAPGSRTRVKVTVFNKGVGHRFPTGTADTHECWIDLDVRDAAGGEIFRSGAIDAAGYLDPDAYNFRAKAVDENGNWLYRRDMWNIAGFETMHTIFPGNFDTKIYDVAIPAHVKGPLKVQARLQFRKLNQKFTDFVFGRGPFREHSGYTGPHPAKVFLPITTIAEGSALVDIGSGGS